MGDYRNYKEIKNRYLRIGIVPLISSIITVAVGGFIIYSNSSDRQFYLIEMLIAALIVLFGILGIIGSLHVYKELPKGDFCCMPSGIGLFSPYFNGAFLINGFLIYAGYFMLEDTEIAALIIMCIFQAFLIMLSMYGIFFNRTYGIVGNGEYIYVLNRKGYKRYTYAEIKCFSDRGSILSFRAYNYDDKVLFRFVRLWDNSNNLIAKMDRNGIKYVRLIHG